jgi:hypothetical protein
MKLQQKEIQEILLGTLVGFEELRELAVEQVEHSQKY